MLLRSYQGKTPRLGKPRFIAPNATIVGDVTLGDGSSVWYGAVIRSDLNPIRIGRDCNVQDNATIHSNRNSVATLGNGVTVGHNAIVHGATIEDDVLVGMHATVLDGAHIGSGSIIAAGAVVLSGMEVVDAICQVKTDRNDRPETEQKMKSVRVDTKGETYPEPKKLKDPYGRF